MACIGGRSGGSATRPWRSWSSISATMLDRCIVMMMMMVMVMVMMMH
jgi:hypothetical protein